MFAVPLSSSYSVVLGATGVESITHRWACQIQALHLFSLPTGPSHRFSPSQRLSLYAVPIPVLPRPVAGTDMA